MPPSSPNAAFGLSIATLVLLLCAPAAASEYRETVEFADVAACVAEYVERFGAADTLFVVDIDNTLLAMRKPLGSDQWFEWQEYLLEHEPDSPLLVADSFGALLEVQSTLFERGAMRPPEPGLPQTVRDIQAHGVPTLVLTSRGDEYRPFTQRELAAGGYKLAKSALRTHDQPRGPYTPYDSGDWPAVGLTEHEATVFGLSPTPRPVSYANGVYMVSGQHKGAMLLALLHRAEYTPEAVVYVDDHGRHVHRVADALARRGIEATVFHYHREDVNVKRFRYGDKTEVDRQWRRLKAELEPAAEPVKTKAPRAAVAR